MNEYYGQLECQLEGCSNEIEQCMRVYALFCRADRATYSDIEFNVLIENLNTLDHASE